MSPTRANRVRPRRAGGDRGVASLELVALLPVTLFIMAVVVQLVLGLATVQATNDAARQAARAYSQGRSASQAAQDSLPARMDVESLSTFGPDYGVSITVQVPMVAPGLPAWTVTRKAVMP
ncbi:TadE/TadG family type IV pilus assembly protein [Angustibacter luteus]|uniref:TadE family protein n=1 Tax=Angustibacter luteus TaxID=658456 RepID=A0ABW1J9A9_9ACTN